MYTEKQIRQIEYQEQQRQGASSILGGRLFTFYSIVNNRKIGIIKVQKREKG